MIWVTSKINLSVGRSEDNFYFILIFFQKILNKLGDASGNVKVSCIKKVFIKRLDTGKNQLKADKNKFNINVKSVERSVKKCSWKRLEKIGHLLDEEYFPGSIVWSKTQHTF